ncbi:CylD protein [Streptococcus equinus]|uniref:[acyl-carrier-protein] S-malonyltransferase n=1 Tax=Streptococcus equinus TaxID=1335 RepID=A0A1H0QQH0_STREI|nr:CylD [Streptococcus equinus]SDP18938.1 CylD protein [Streptococcus equinus]
MSTVIYGGQGNVQLKHLHQMAKTEKGQALLLQLQECDLESYQLFQNILEKKCGLDGLHAAMLSTFLYNIWLTQAEAIVTGTRFSAHSAGIFNVLLASESANFQDIILFIKKRAQLVENLSRLEELWLVITEDMDLLRQKVLNCYPEKFQLAILTDEISGVLAMKEDSLAELQELAEKAACPLKVKRLGVKAPYHTSFLSQAKDDYCDLVDDLNIVQNRDFSYIFHCDDLKDEILYQWDHLFDWQKIKEEILSKDTDVLDLSPNKFISKQLMKMKRRKEKK